MTEMGVAHVTDDFSTNHAVGAVYQLTNVFRIERLEIAGPAAAGIKFCIRLKQWRIAADTSINAMLMVIPIASCKSPFRGGVSGHLVFHRGQLVTPFFIGLGDFVCHDEQLTSSSAAQSGGRAAY